MLIYICTFLASTGFIFLAQKSEKKGRILSLLLLLFAVLIPSFLAGARELSIGTDVVHYIYPLYSAANASSSFASYLHISLWNGWKFVPISSYEFGYTFLVYIVTKIFKNIFSVLFFNELIIITCIISGLWKLREDVPVWLGALVYFFCFYNLSLNIVRQSIAVAIVFLGFSNYLINNNWVRYIITVVIASLFHISAIVGILILFLKYIIEHDGVLHVKEISKTLLLFLIILLIVFIPHLLASILRIVGFANYSEGYITGSATVALNQILIRIPIFIVFFSSWKSYKDCTKYFWLEILLYDIALSQLTNVSDFANRATMYFSIFYLYIIPYKYDYKSRLQKFITLMGILVYLGVYWYYEFVVMGYGQTVPYQIASIV